MPSGINDYGAGYWAELMVGLQSIPSAYWIALCTQEPGDASDGTILQDFEPDTAAGYARVSYTTGASYWGVNGQYVTNTATVDFGVPTAAWGLLTHFALTDDPVAGNLFAYGEMHNAVNADITTDVQLPPGGIVLAIYTLDPSIAI